MTKDEALKMAIEALEFIKDGGFYTGEDDCIEACKAALKHESINLSCKSVQKRLATQWGYVKQHAQVQKPIGYISTFPVVTPQAIRLDKNEVFNIPVYTYPTTQPHQEPNLWPYLTE